MYVKFIFGPGQVAAWPLSQVTLCFFFLCILGMVDKLKRTAIDCMYS